MPDSPAVSIVMPVRNAESTLPATLDSIRAQSFAAWECIAVNDGSYDATMEILNHAAREDKRIRIISTPPLGIARALQTGCSAACGGWIARMDADDIMHPHRLDAQLDHARQHPDVGLVSCLVHYGGDAAGYAAHVDWLNSVITPDEIASQRFVESPVAHPSVIFRRDLLERHGGYHDGDFPEDYELWLRWLDAGVRFGKVPEYLLTWNDPPSRLSRKDPRYAPDRFYQIKCTWLARWLRAHVDASRPVMLWGAGRITRRRFDALEHDGIHFAGFIDVDPKKANQHRDGRRVIMAESIPPPSDAFIIVGVANRGAGSKIHAFLCERGYREGRDFLLAA